MTPRRVARRWCRCQDKGEGEGGRAMEGAKEAEDEAWRECFASEAKH